MIKQINRPTWPCQTPGKCLDSQQLFSVLAASERLHLWKPPINKWKSDNEEEKEPCSESKWLSPLKALGADRNHPGTVWTQGCVMGRAEAGQS